MAEMNNIQAKDEGSSLSLIQTSRPSSNSRNIIIFGLFVVCAIFLGLGAWSATAQLARAVSALGTLAVKGERKQIQHFEGGIVNAMPVQEGQMVKKGELLVSLNPLRATASVARHNGQLDQALARKLRLESELKGDSVIEISGRLLARMAEDQNVFGVLQSEQQHLTARLETLKGAVAI